MSSSMKQVASKGTSVHSDSGSPDSEAVSESQSVTQLARLGNTQPGTASIGIQTNPSESANLIAPLWVFAIFPPNKEDVADLQLNQHYFEPPASKPFPLYNDVLQVVFRFLSPKDLTTAIHLSKHFHRAFESVHSIGLTTHASKKTLLRLPVQTPMARHIGCATNLTDAIKFSHNMYFEGFNILPHLVSLLPNLTTLTIPTFTGTIHSLNLPPLLKELIIQIDDQKWVSSIFKSVQRLKHLQVLSLHVQQLPNKMLFEGVDFSPLIHQSSQLESLHIISLGNGAVATELSNPSLVEFIRQSSVRKLSLNLPVLRPSDSLTQLLNPTADGSTFPLMRSGNLTSITLPRVGLDRALLSTFLLYPSLIRLKPAYLDLEGNEIKMLSQLPNVTKLLLNSEVNASTIYSRMKSQMIVSACQYLTNLRRLAVRTWRFNRHQLDECLKSLPHLTDLDVNGYNSINTLSFLGKYGLPQRLTRLALKEFSVPVSELLNYVKPLRNLVKLHLVEVCCTNTNSPWQLQFQAVMPNLANCQIRLFNPHRNWGSSPHIHLFPSYPNQHGTRFQPFSPWIQIGKTKEPQNPKYPLAASMGDHSMMARGDETEVYYSINCMGEYSEKSFEELRLEDEECDGRSDATPDSVKGISIVEASYGLPALRMDVTARVRSALLASPDPDLKFQVTNAIMGGDPIPFQVKECIITFSVNGGLSQQMTIVEQSYASFPTIISAPLHETTTAAVTTQLGACLVSSPDTSTLGSSSSASLFEPYTPSFPFNEPATGTPQGQALPFAFQPSNSSSTFQLGASPRSLLGPMTARTRKKFHRSPASPAALAVDSTSEHGSVDVAAPQLPDDSSSGSNFKTLSFGFTSSLISFGSPQTLPAKLEFGVSPSASTTSSATSNSAENQ